MCPYYQLCGPLFPTRAKEKEDHNMGAGRCSVAVAPVPRELCCFATKPEGAKRREEPRSPASCCQTLPGMPPKAKRPRGDIFWSQREIETRLKSPRGLPLCASRQQGLTMNNVTVRQKRPEGCAARGGARQHL